MGQLAFPPISFIVTGYGSRTTPVGLVAVNGVANTIARSDSAPALSQAIVPVWTGQHVFTGNWQNGAGTYVGMSLGGISGVVAGCGFELSGAPLNEKIWNLFASSPGHSLALYLTDDASATDKQALMFTRAGQVLTQIEYGNPVDAPLNLFRGLLRLSSYGAGTLTTDASGNVTAVSDERLKDNVRPFVAGLQAILALDTITHGWKPATGLDQSRKDYVGFLAQQVAAVIPEAVGRMRVEKRRALKAGVATTTMIRRAREGVESPTDADMEEIEVPAKHTDSDFDIEYDADAPMTFNDRAVLAALVNAVKELATALDIQREAPKPGMVTRAWNAVTGMFS